MASNQKTDPRRKEVVILCARAATELAAFATSDPEALDDERLVEELMSLLPQIELLARLFSDDRELGDGLRSLLRTIEDSYSKVLLAGEPDGTA